MRELRYVFSLIHLCFPLCVLSGQNMMMDTPFGLNERDYETYAVLTPTKETQISSEMEGQVKAIYFLPGDHFKQGETLIEFDCAPTDIQVKRLVAVTEVTAAKLQSNEVLKKMNSVSELDLKIAQSENEKAKADLELMELKQSKCSIKAAYEGDVITKFVNHYEMVKIDDPLLDVMSNENLQIQMYIPSAWLREVDLGAVFNLSLKELGPKAVLTGQIKKIVGKVDAASQSVLVFGELLPLLDPSIKLFAGMSGQATFDLKKRTSENAVK